MPKKRLEATSDTTKVMRPDAIEHQSRNAVAGQPTAAESTTTAATTVHIGTPRLKRARTGPTWIDGEAQTKLRPAGSARTQLFAQSASTALVTPVGSSLHCDETLDSEDDLPELAAPMAAEQYFTEAVYQQAQQKYGHLLLIPKPSTAVIPKGASYREAIQFMDGQDPESFDYIANAAEAVRKYYQEQRQGTLREQTEKEKGNHSNSMSSQSTQLSSSGSISSSTAKSGAKRRR